MEIKNKYWKGFEELNKDPQFVKESRNEFYEGLPLDEVLNESNLALSSNRRDFLKFFGFSVSAVALAACNTAPVKNVIPYVVKPEEVTPGVPNYYASSFNGVPIVVKTREGRPIKLDGNIKSTVTGGGLDSIGQASILSLYDTLRVHKPLKGGKPSTWATIDGEISSKLAKIAGQGAGIAIVTPSLNSPSTLAVINDFKAKYPTTKHIQYDAVSYNGILKANELCFGKAVIPSYSFDKAEVIVSFSADFLGSWISGTEFSYQWSKNRNLKNGQKNMSRHYQFEGQLSLTGSNADVRMPLKPSEEGAAIITLHNEIAKLAGAPSVGSSNNKLAGGAVSKAAHDLWEHKGKALVVSGSNDPSVQAVVNYINAMLGSYGTTIDLDNPSLQYKAMDAEFPAFVKELNSGSIKGVILYNVNPAYTAPEAKSFSEGLKKAELSVAVGLYEDETAAMAQYCAPDHHYLESWNDYEPKAGYFTLCQPTIHPVMESRQLQTSLLTWADAGQKDYYEYVKAYWEKNIHPTQSKHASFRNFWNESLQNGIYAGAPRAAAPASLNANLGELVGKIEAQKSNGIELITYEAVNTGDGAYSNNPILQELPDPISKVTWDNYASISKATADKLGVKEGDVVNVSAKGYTLEKLPVIVQPGQARDTVAIALGYGRTVGVKEAIGQNAYPFRSVSADGSVSTFTTDVKIEKAAGSYELARTQTHHSIEGRDIVKEATLEGYIADAKVNNHDHHALIRDKKRKDQLFTLWEEQDNKGHKWAMAIDLNSCTGCGSCIVSCNIENNVPVVGRDEVRRRREMHWLRIDRYYRFSPETPNPTDKQTGMGYTQSGDIELKYETFAYDDHPETYDHVTVTHMPMLCQHCGHAPCETVCPVLATTHSAEGLNQMTYNRCIGTKYCANNCPYKVRRFNWFRYNDRDKFDYYMNNDLGKMVINPDVTVRTRGVMEKCSFCVQRIQYGKLQAKLEGRKIKDGEVKTACQESCPTGAIVFGDLKDPDSEISKLYRNERSYHVLEELNVQPSIVYMTKIRNNEALAPKKGAEHHEDTHAKH